MRILPNTTFKIYQNINVDDDVTIAFQNKANREAYFARHKVAEFKSQVQRKSGALKFNLKYLNGASLDKCNYLSFQNPAYDDVIYYCRIISKDYVNNETAAVTFGIDYWMTKMFDVKYNNMYIDREHLNQEQQQEVEQCPFTPTVPEMRTPEFLPYGNTEKKHYSDRDMEFLSDKLPLNGKDEYTVIYLSSYNEASVSGEFLDWWIELRKSFEAGGANSEKGAFFWEVDENINGDWKRWTNRVAHPYDVYVFPPDAPDEYSANELIKRLTKSNLVETILCMYSIPEFMIMPMMAGRYDTPEFTLEINDTSYGRTKADYSKTDPKLMNFPYSYFRVVLPDGNTGEFKYEEFMYGNLGTTGRIRFNVTGDMAQKPKLMLLPLNYTYGSANGANSLQAITFDKFPTIPYTIDAWTAQIAAIAANQVADYTMENLTALRYSQQYETGARGAIRNAVNYTSDMLDALPNIATQKQMTPQGLNVEETYRGGNLPGIIAANRSYESAERNREIAEIRNENFVAARNQLSGSRTVLESNYFATQPAYAKNIYVKSDQDGMSFFQKYAFLDVLFLHVTPEPIYLERFTEYFDHYGYKSIRCGIPHVLGYTKGNDEPAWKELDGQKATYVKTVDAKVIASDVTIASNIKTMLDSGIRMLKGEELA